MSRWIGWFHEVDEVDEVDGMDGLIERMGEMDGKTLR